LAAIFSQSLLKRHTLFDVLTENRFSDVSYEYAFRWLRLRLAEFVGPLASEFVRQIMHMSAEPEVWPILVEKLSCFILPGFGWFDQSWWFVM
jgi:hypothetical protein